MKHMHPSLSWRSLPESAGGSLSASLAVPTHHEGRVLVIQGPGPGLADATSPWDLLLVDTEAKKVHTLGTCDGLQERGGRCVLTHGELLEACGGEGRCFLAERRFMQVFPVGRGGFPALAAIARCETTVPWQTRMRSEDMTSDLWEVLSGMNGSSCSPPPLNMEDAADLITMHQAAAVLGARRGGVGTSGSA